MGAVSRDVRRYRQLPSLPTLLLAQNLPDRVPPRPRAVQNKGDLGGVGFGLPGLLFAHAPNIAQEVGQPREMGFQVERLKP